MDITTIKLKKVYEDALKLYKEKEIKLNYEKHIKTLFKYAITIRMDFVSKKCLNPIFRQALLQNGYKKSQEFRNDVKKSYPHTVWFASDSDKIVFGDD